MLRPRKDLDEADAETLKTLGTEKRCQQRIITDGGHHYVYCGAYFHERATKTKNGYRCSHHAT
jgi:hypothetical protein